MKKVVNAEVVAEQVTVGAGGNPVSTEAGALGCVVLLVSFREKVDVDTIIAYLGKASGCRAEFAGGDLVGSKDGDG